MDANEKIELLKDVANDLGASFRERYSGRGMFGRECPGIVFHSPTEVIELAAEKGIRGAMQDSMGTRTIVYWPCILYPQTETQTV